MTKLQLQNLEDLSEAQEISKFRMHMDGQTTPM